MGDKARDQIDELLDGALAQYANPEPRQGLEGRVWNRIRAERAVPRRRWLSWAAPAAIAAAGFVMGAVYWSHDNRPQPRRTAVPAAVNQARQTPPATPVPVTAAAAPRKRARTQQSVAHHPRWPKLPVFPAPQPLSKEERAWLAFARRSPQLAAEALRWAPPTEIQPIRVEAIQIPPLDTGGPQN